ncbi:uncharacterized protein J3R85_016243 [Psidium guajava]|nr:uncharacterized protein J3R85_016243 [Psidium guajava]
MKRLSSLKGANQFLRRNRKWPLSPYKTKWHQTFCEEQAMRTLKDAVKTTVEPLCHHRNQHLLQNPTGPNLVTTLVDSFGAYNCEPTPNAYRFVIQSLCETLQFHLIPPVLHHIRSVEKFETPEYILSNLIKFYGDFNKIEDAVCLFLDIPKFRCVPTVYSLNALLSVLCRSRDHLKMVPQILLKSQQMNIRIDESTFRIMIGALCRLKKVNYAVDILNRLISDGFSVDGRICSLILSSFCGQRNFSSIEVLGFVEQLRKMGFLPGLVDYTNVMKYLVKGRRGNDALDVLNQMKVDGIKPDTICYTMVLSGIIAEEDYEKAEELFDEMLVLGLVPDVYTYNVYIDGLCKQNNLEAAVEMVACMKELGCRPNDATYITIIKRSCKVGELNRARQFVREIGVKSFGLMLQIYMLLIEGFSGNGKITEASDLVDELLIKSSRFECLTVDEIVCSLCKRRLFSKVPELLEAIVRKGIIPGAMTWEALVHNCGFEINLLESSLTELVNSTQVE